MKIIEHKKVERTVEEVVGIACDTCKERITIAPWYEVMTYHNDWGHDSIDSYEHSDFCSYSCMTRHQDEYFRIADGSEKYDIERHEDNP